MSSSAIYRTKPWSFILTYNIIYYFLIFVKIPLVCAGQLVSRSIGRLLVSCKTVLSMSEDVTDILS